MRPIVIPAATGARKPVTLRGELHGKSGNNVYDRGKPTVSTRIDAAVSSNRFSGFHRDRKDRTPAREIVTARIFGDPAPGKFDHRAWAPPADGYLDPYHGMGSA